MYTTSLYIHCKNISIRVKRHNQTAAAKYKLRWLDRLKNDGIRQKYGVFKNIISKALEHL